MLKFKKGDKIKVTAGKDKGRESVIEKVFPKEGKALIPDVNIYKKHVKGVGKQKGGIYDIPRPLSFASIQIVCPKCKKLTRVGFKMVGNNKVRICKKCNREIDKKKV